MVIADDLAGGCFDLVIVLGVAAAAADIEFDLVDLTAIVIIQLGLGDGGIRRLHPRVSEGDLLGPGLSTCPAEAFVLGAACTDAEAA